MEQSVISDWNHLRAFFWVARSASFTTAARTLGIPKSTLSRQIQALEQSLHTRLLQRTTRRIALTEIGSTFFAHCERVMAEMQDAERAVRAYTAEPGGLLRVGVPVTFARSFLAPLLPAFCHKYPGIRLDLVLRGGRLDPLEMMLDVVIHVGRLADSSYVVRKLGSMPQSLHASKAYLAQHPTPSRPEDLSTHSMVAFSRSPAGSRLRLFAKDGTEKIVPLDPRLVAGDPVVAHTLVAGGLGIAVLPAFITRHDSRLVPVLPDWQPAPVEFFALYPARSLPAPKLRVFLEELEQMLRF
ncbi:MAG: LysR family transcriptional regulator [Bryobacterales bacterium]|nr:LysR family transcriptional regulator [Bryobacterales bacterium]